MTVRRVLVVCTANQCRSPMAHGLIQHRLETQPDGAAAPAAIQIEVSSAGTWAAPGMAPTLEATQVMAERGIDISHIRSEEITAESVDASDLILVMTSGHKEAIEADFSAARGKTLRMSELAGGAWDVVDPIGGTIDDYRATARELERLIDQGWQTITGSNAGSSYPR